MTETVRPQKRITWEDKLNSLSDADLKAKREETAALVNLFSNAEPDTPRKKHYKNKLDLIDCIIEKREGEL